MFWGSQGYALNVVHETEGVEILLDPGQVATPHEPRRGCAGELAGVQSPSSVGK
jgi:hypothetical protein